MTTDRWDRKAEEIVRFFCEMDGTDSCDHSHGFAQLRAAQALTQAYLEGQRAGREEGAERVMQYIWRVKEFNPADVGAAAQSALAAIRKEK